MKVTKDMLHKDLQRYYLLGNAVSLLFRTRWSAKIMSLLTNLIFRGKNIKSLSCAETYVNSSDGNYKIRVKIYKPVLHEPNLPIMLYIHGGGYLIGNPENFSGTIENYIKKRPCIVVAPDYRKALEQPYPAGHNDCYDVLLWAKENAAQLGGRPDKMIIAGHSGGGGLCAAVMLKVRDTQDVDVAFQMPIYPMLDHRQPDDPDRAMDCPSWDTKANRNGWSTYLADLNKQGAEIPAYASPALNTDYSGFPPTISFVGVLEPFYQETVDYIEGIKAAGVDVLFKEYEGCIHGFEIAFPNTGIGKDGVDFTVNSYAEFYDKYITEAEASA